MAPQLRSSSFGASEVSQRQKLFFCSILAGLLFLISASMKISQQICFFPAFSDYILYPDVPIALRMSGHLLLGVVRIYSQQVDYLFKDCNSILTRLNKLFTYEDINLPENAIQAPFESITLSMPNSFELDAMELDLNDNEGYVCFEHP